MKVWTIQEPIIWETLQAQGVWRTSFPYVCDAWPVAYRWMAKQLALRSEPSSFDEQAPIWVWSQWNGVKKTKPDLCSRGYLMPGTSAVRLELDIDENRVLLSDFLLWHIPLNNGYIGRSGRDAKQFDKALSKAGLWRESLSLLPQEWRSRIEDSWVRIFDLAWEDRYFVTAMADKSIQGVMWELRLEDVRDVTHFVAR
ncbi:DUF3841 domain-containing protein [Thiothrix subterranea]|uniref:DUF3841 domain-containing protein n=1 Tax=Thiothrix subterranea TaxID=2735563 RepID=UPI00192B80C1|nr:DUF3841 domain-containing protein [Thiothrix subterranea]QQZ28049.1 DUF3841 domain-containing protein [Thiothrix subterranea]